jgi:hypothetical protein
MSALASAIRETIRSALEALDGLAKTDPGAVDEIIAALVADLRTRRPVAVASLAAGFAPTEPVRDPRAG